MPITSIYPGSVEIKRIINAVKNSDVQIAKIEIEPARVRIFATCEPSEEPLSAYDIWKASQSGLD